MRSLSTLNNHLYGRLLCVMIEVFEVFGARVVEVWEGDSHSPTDAVVAWALCLECVAGSSGNRALLRLEFLSACIGFLASMSSMGLRLTLHGFSSSVYTAMSSTGRSS